MTQFVIELYVAPAETGAVERRLAAMDATGEGAPARYLHSMYVPEDETCFLIYEGDSADVVRAAAQRAGLAFERVAEVVTSDKPETRRPKPEAPAGPPTGAGSPA